MSSSTISNASLAEIAAINASSTIFVRTWCFGMIVLGLIGHCLNVYVFTRPILRHNPCSRYFLASALSGFLVVGFNFPIRLMQAGYTMNIVTQSAIACQMITMILFWARAQPSWFIVLASIDRYLCSSKSARLRGWSSLRVTNWVIPLTSLLVLAAYFHVPMYHAINVQQRLCFPVAGFYQKFFGVWNLVVFSVGPPVLMLLFGFLTVQHIRQSLGRIAPTVPSQTRTTTGMGAAAGPGGVGTGGNEIRQRRKNADRQLIQMLLVQCMFFTLTASPTSVQYIYTSIRETMVVDNVQRAKDNFFYTIAGFVSLTGPCTSFYLFTLASKLFRHELRRLLPGERRSFQGSTHQSNNHTGQRK